MFIRFFFSNGLVLFFAIWLDFLSETVIWLLFYNSLRFFIGGNHAKTFIRCLVGGTLFSIVCISLTKTLVGIKGVLLFECIFSILVTFFLSPVVHPNRALSQIEIERKSKIGKVIVLAETILVIIISNAWNTNLGQSAALGMTSAAALCVLGKISR